MATRRTHIVRIGTSTDLYIDMEVLDAVAFRTDSGKEMVLNLPGANAAPYIIDDTGDNNQKFTANPTRRSHMKRITGSGDKQFLDIEVLDAVAFRDDMGKEWIMDLQPGSSDSSPVYNTTTNTLSSPYGTSPTRMVHDEKIYSDPNDKTSDFIAVERCDTMSFRSVRGEEMIIVMPSSDDGSGSGRADTVTTPANYDPNSTDVVPPANTDPSVYAFIPPGSKGALIGDKADATVQIACGPLWWPRGASKKGGPWYQYVSFQQPTEVSMYEASFDTHGWNNLEWQVLPNVGAAYSVLHPERKGAPLPPFGYLTLDSAILDGSITDWGLLDFSDTRIDVNAKNGLNAFACVPGVSGVPDIWQLSKVPAPALIPTPLGKPVDKDTTWVAGQVTTALAKQVAMAYLAAWNDTSFAYNTEMAAACGPVLNIYVDTPGYGLNRVGNTPCTYGYPSTSFGVPLWDCTPERIADWLIDGRFMGGIPIDFWNGRGFVFIFTPPFAESIGVAQLDPTKWDTSNPYVPVLRHPPPTAHDLP